jgi:DUF438 domain-containing protein
MSDQNPTFQIPKDVIEPIIKSHVSAAIISALSNHENLFREAVTRVLTQKVDSDGKPSHYVSDRSDEFITWLCKDAVRNATRDVMHEEVSKYKDQIKTQIVALLSKKNSPFIKQMCESLTTGMISALDNKWKLSVSLHGD